MNLRWAHAAAIALLAACSEGDPPKATRDQLLDPKFCRDCHPKHYEEWSASMHAYASRDPVFLAMNRRGQEEAEIEEFCVQCHAPMALREGAIDDFADLTDLPDHLQGVTCYFCHNAVAVNEPHSNANIELANDTIMRGAMLEGPPVESPAHGVLRDKSPLHDRRSLESSKLCGACHDIVNPLGLELERTFLEYQDSVVANAAQNDGFSSCQGCHMKAKNEKEPAAYSEDVRVYNRVVHWHLFPAVDVALTPELPHQEMLRAAIEYELRATTFGEPKVEIDVDWRAGERFAFRIAIEQVAGHNVPSGATADRRLWFEVTVYDESDRIVLESGKLADGELEEKPKDHPKHDPQFRPFRDYLVDADGNETHMFWDAAQISRSELIPVATTSQSGSHTAYRTFVTNESATRPPPRIEIRLRLRPMGVDVLQDLVQSGHLDATFIDAMPTFTAMHVIAVLSPDGRTYKVRDAPGFDSGDERFRQLYEEATRGL